MIASELAKESGVAVVTAPRLSSGSVRALRIVEVGLVAAVLAASALAIVPGIRLGALGAVGTESVTVSGTYRTDAAAERAGARAAAHATPSGTFRTDPAAAATAPAVHSTPSGTYRIDPAAAVLAPDVHATPSGTYRIDAAAGAAGAQWTAPTGWLRAHHSMQGTWFNEPAVHPTPSGTYRLR